MEQSSKQLCHSPNGIFVSKNCVIDRVPFRSSLNSRYICSSKIPMLWAKNHDFRIFEGLNYLYEKRCSVGQAALGFSHNSDCLGDERSFELIESGEFDEEEMASFASKRQILVEANSLHHLDGMSHCNVSKKQHSRELNTEFFGEASEEELSCRILSLSRSNKVKSALLLFKYMQASGFLASSHACNSLLMCLVRNKRFDSAVVLFQFMKANKLTSNHTYSLILKAVADNQGWDSAIKVLVECERNAEEIEKLDIVVYNTLITICCRVNNWIEAEKLWRKINGKGYHSTPITYSLLIALFVRCSQDELALDAYCEMIQKGVSPRKDAMQAAISASVREEKWDLALTIFQTMLSSGIEPNLTACNSLINSLGRCGRVEQAFDIYSKLKSLGHAPDSYTWTALMSCLYRSEKYFASLQLFESLRAELGNQLDSHMYNIALMSCKKLRLWDRAVQLLWQMEVSGLLVQTSSYNIVIGACEAARRPKVALEVYDHMVECNCSPDTFTFLSLLRACMWGSLWTDVDDIMKHVAPDASLYNAVIHGMCLRGRTESARRMYFRMGQNGIKPDGKTRALMLQNFQKRSIRGKKHRRWR